MKKPQASRDDGQIIDEIEKTIQGLLNLNILESSSNSESTDCKPGGSSSSPDDSDACPAGTVAPAGGSWAHSHDRSGSDGKWSRESAPKINGVASNDTSFSTQKTTTSPVNIQEEERVRELQKEQYVEEATKVIMEKIQVANVQNMS